MKKPPLPGSAPEVWGRYALEVNGYELAGGRNEIGGNEPAEAVYAEARKEIEETGAITGDHTRLRIALFLHQRHLRVLQPSEAEMAREQGIADVILATLQDAASGAGVPRP
jgi:hypothetical protein